MNPENLSTQDQIYYYHGLILFLADEADEYDFYEVYLRRHRTLDELKQQVERLNQIINGDNK